MEWRGSSPTTGQQARRKWPFITRLLNGFGLGPRLANSLMRADMRFTAAEYTLVVVATALLGLAIGALRGNPLMGAVLAVVLGYLPIAYVNSRGSGRRRRLTEQLPDVLTLLVGGLRAGLGLTQAIDMVVRQIPEPAAKEFARVTRAINLGQSVQRALNDMAERAGSDDLDLVVSAMNVQYEMGGNLAQTLDIIGETVRDRIRMKREIRTLTAQQRFTGYALALLPVILGGILFLLNPDYMKELTAAGLDVPADCRRSDDADRVLHHHQDPGHRGVRGGRWQYIDDVWFHLVAHGLCGDARAGRGTGLDGAGAGNPGQARGRAFEWLPGPDRYARR